MFHTLAAKGESVMPRVLRCYAEGHNKDWEAICLDLDVAVQGESFEDVFHALNESIQLHIEAVMALPESEQAHLLRRPAPFLVRLKFLLYVLRSMFSRSDDANGYHHQFTVPCVS